jgi:acetylornithine deacetylase/succinyl-diaminopimelate desuccinylase-like protein
VGNLVSSQYVSTLTDLISVPSSVGAESLLLSPIEEKLEKLGFKVTIKNSNPSSWHLDTQGSPPLLTNYENPQFLIAYPPKERDSGLLLFAHYDTERLPADNQKPIEFSEDESKYYGHGIADDKAGVAAILLAVENLSTNVEIKLPAIVIAQAKHGGCYGMSEAIASLKNRTGAIYCHPAESNKGFSQIKVASRGIATFNVKFTGKLPLESEENTPASADPRLGKSALTLSANFISEANNWVDPDIVWLLSDISTAGKDFRVPEVCELRISVWFRNLSIEEIEAVLQSRFLEFCSNYEMSIEDLPQIVGIRANPAATTNEAFIENVKTTITKHSGESVSEYDWHAASDIRFPLLHLKIPAVGFGCLAGGFYGGKEWVDKTSFHQFVEIVIELTRNYAR